MTDNIRKKSIEYEPSETALAAASLRALAANDELIKGPDILAEIFLTEYVRKVLKDPSARQYALSKKVLPGMYEFMIARTAFFDTLVKKSFQENTPQVVFLGAGYDSRPYRFSGLIKNTRIFELDAAPTQRRKMEMLNMAGIKIPDEVRFVPVNFSTGDFIDILKKSGFIPGSKTLFVWEGVTYYLAEQVIDSTLKAIKSTSPAGSSVGFDYASILPDPLKKKSAGKFRDSFKSRYSSEPVKFAIKNGGMEPFLNCRGFKLLEHLDSDEMEKMYLGKRKHICSIPYLFCLAHASVSD